MESIGTECQELKKKYDDCFNDWFDEYLRGRRTEACQEVFAAYKNCVYKVMQQKGLDVDDAKTKVLGTVKEMKPKPGDE